MSEAIFVRLREALGNDGLLSDPSECLTYGSDPLMKAVKAQFDPDELLNPGKLVT